MRALIIGAGLIGVTTAWYLRRAGCDVTVVERRDAPGMETSFANGGILTPSLSDPWNAPGVWKKLLKSPGREDSPLLLRTKALPGLMRWGTIFLRHSTPARYRRNALANLALGEYSLRCLDELRESPSPTFEHSTCGTLKLFRSRGALTERRESLRFLAEAGLRSETLDADACVALEPALADIAGDIAGGLHFPDDQSGDAHQFCRSLAVLCRGQGVGFQYETAVEGLRVGRDAVSAVATSRGELTADIVVLASGSETPRLAGAAGIRVPIAPVKGYSLTVPADESVRPVVPVLDDALHATATPLGARLRIAGTAEFAGYDRRCDTARVENLQRMLAQIYPAIARRSEAGELNAWCGLRPMVADGVPLIGRTSLRNLYINAGHGHLGWTMAAGAGRLLADLIGGESPGLDAGPYRPQRFGGS